jgi:cytochrome c oxidase assembly protein subunit 15
MGFTLIQVGMGTQVREAVDLIATHHNYIDREYWRDSFPLIFYVHRSFSAVILFTNLWLAWKISICAVIIKGCKWVLTTTAPNQP